MRSRWGDTTESLELVRCHDFIGPPGSGASLAQPFEVVVDGQVGSSRRAHPPHPKHAARSKRGRRSHPHGSAQKSLHIEIACSPVDTRDAPPAATALNDLRAWTVQSY